MFPIISQMGIYLVGDHKEVILIGQGGDGLRACPIHNSPRGIVGITQQQNLGLICDVFFDILYTRPKTVLRFSRHLHRYTPAMIVHGLYET